MESSTMYTSITFLIFFIVSPHISHAQGPAESSWPMFMGSSARTGRYDGPARSIDGTLNWKSEENKWFRSSPSVGPDGTIYIGLNGLFAYKSNGSLKWIFPTDNHIFSSPAINSEGTIFAGSYDTYFYAVNADGTLQWKFKTGGWVESSPAIAEDGTIYFGSCDSTFYAMNPDGSLQWAFKADSWIRATPAIGNGGTIYFGSEQSWFYALNPDGSLFWKKENIDCGYTSPAIGNDGTIYTRSGSGIILALSPDGEKIWEITFSPNNSSSPAIGKDGTIYVYGSGSTREEEVLFAISPQGTVQWRCEWTNEDYYPIPTSLVIGSDGTIYFHRIVNCGDGECLIAVSPTGQILFDYYLGQVPCWDNWGPPPYSMTVSSTPVFGSDGTMYVGSCSGLFAFAPVPDVNVESSENPVEFELSQNYPNPFNPQTTISYTLPEPGHVRIDIFNALGQHVETLRDGYERSGNHQVVWNAERIPNGVYFCRLEYGEHQRTIKMLVMK